jgi:hypothetical protein
MYLLNTETFTLHYFSEPHIPDYAILSHTWNKVEVSFAEMQANKNIQEAAAFSPFSDASIAERMSWASKRVTSRTEDVAYCLLGIFGVSIPPLYGEGNNAFLRLQQEIMRTRNDETIFAWTIDTGETSDFHGGLLAYSLAAFRYSGNVRISKFDEDRTPYQMTNKGLCLDLLLFSPGEDSEDYLKAGGFIAVLNCSRNNSDDFLAIFLQNIDSEQYVRARPEALPAWGRSMGLKLGRKLIYVQQPSASPHTVRQEFCTLFLRIQGLGIFHNSLDTHVDPFSIFKNGQRQLGRAAREEEWLRPHEGEFWEIKLHARNDGRLYFAFQFGFFFILLNFSEKPFGANIATATYRFGNNIRFVTDPGNEFLSSDLRCCTFDRLSRASLSGDSISLTFKRGVVDRNARDGGQQFIVHVTVGSSGHLQWPDPNETQPENQWRFTVPSQ